MSNFEESLLARESLGDKVLRAIRNNDGITEPEICRMYNWHYGRVHHNGILTRLVADGKIVYGVKITNPITHKHQVSKLHLSVVFRATLAR